MTMAPPIPRLLLLVALSFFLGLAFEEFYARVHQKRPGGIRTFPLLALSGSLLYRLDATHLLPLTAGLLALSAWLTCYYWQHLKETDADGFPNVGLIVPICNVLAYLLGPVALAEPPWVAIGTTVTAVLFLTAREGLHDFARRVELSEIVNAGRFLLLTGFILPLLPNTPVTDLSTITPRQVWLAMVAVCSVSYASYLSQRYVAPASAGLLTAVLGGMYSSTATTVVLARRAKGEGAASRQTQTGIVLATTIMYLRLLIVIAVFNRPLAFAAAPFLLGLATVGLLLSAGLYWLSPQRHASESPAVDPPNPLELGAAAIFAALFIVVSLASSWAVQQFGTAGIYVLAVVVGVSDIDPFVLSLAQHGAGEVSVAVGVVAILLATSSNNLLKAAYVVAYSGGSRWKWPTGALVALAACGIGVAMALV
jgi:uncharacterized membrane protein (DUF4010 family)